MTMQESHYYPTVANSTTDGTATITTAAAAPPPSMDKAMRHMLEAEFFRPFRDVQYYSLGAITSLATLAYNNQEEHQRRHKEEKKKKENQDDDDDDEESDDDGPSSTATRVAERLVEILLMIPVPTSQEELDSSQFLFPPPRNAIPDEEEEEENVDEDDGSDDDNDSDDGSDSDDDDDESADDNNRPIKRQKTEQEHQHKFAFQQMRMFRREYQKAWLAVLRLPLSMGSLKRTLQFLPTNVLNYGRTPLRFADFFMQAYSDNDSGIVGVMALDGLFILITEYGLEYPNFYKQLYRLVSSRVLYAKYRTRFFSLLNKCLARNEMLPAHIVAAFLKRLCRVALSGPPPGALFVLALVSNLLRKHPECNCLIQRNGTEMEDPFLPEQDDPVECRALQSSLWELAVFERHYFPAVATIAKSIGTQEEAKAPLYVVEDFASHTFTSLFEQEKKTKTKTALTFKEPVSLFTQDDVFSDFFQIGSTT